MFGYPNLKKRDVRTARIGGPSLTKQSFLDEADINKIMKKYSMNDIELAKQAVQEYDVDLSETGTYHEAMNTIAEAGQMFMKIPSNIREMFNHDAGKFLDFMSDPANAEEMVELGLADKVPQAQQPQVASEQEAQPPKGGKKATKNEAEQSTPS